MLFGEIDITAAFLALSAALTRIIEFAKFYNIRIANYYISIYDLAVGALVIGTILSEFLPWGDDEEKEVLWED